MEIKVKRKHGFLRVLKWEPQPGKPIPLPLIADDRALFPVDVVKGVSAWLLKRRPEFEKDQTPTPIVISVGETIDGHKAGIQTRSKLRVRYGKIGDPPERIGIVDFVASTYEMLLRSRKRQIEAKYTYLVARDAAGRIICGPRLREKQTALILLAS
jgi:hypothetical protein